MEVYHHYDQVREILTHASVLLCLKTSDTMIEAGPDPRVLEHMSHLTAPYITPDHLHLVEDHNKM